MTIDTKIRHMTQSGADIFLELGFPLDEAKRLQAAAQQVNDAKRYEADDGPLSTAQVRQIEKLAPQGSTHSVRSSLFDPENE
jgi:hypothetical protein